MRLRVGLYLGQVYVAQELGQGVGIGGDKPEQLLDRADR